MSATDGQPPDLANLLFQAHALIERRRFAQARTLVGQGLREFPDNTQLQYFGAFVDYSEDRTEEATRGVGAVLAGDPHHYGARFLSAHLHEKAQQFIQAEAVWIELLREYPESPDCYAAYADLMLRTLHVEKAWRLTQEGLRHGPDHELCLYVASLIDVIHGKSGRADNPHLQRLLQQHPERLNTLRALVISLDQRGETRGALRVAQQLLRTSPDSEPLARLVRQLKMRSHWSLLPLYPMQRWGWAGAAAVTAAGFIAVRVSMVTLPEAAATAVLLLWLAYVVYSWVWPPILRKLL